MCHPQTLGVGKIKRRKQPCRKSASKKRGSMPVAVDPAKRRSRKPHERKVGTSSKRSGRITVLNRPICFLRIFSASDLKIKQIGRLKSVYLSNLCTRHSPNKLTPRGHEDWPDKRATRRKVGFGCHGPQVRFWEMPPAAAWRVRAPLAVPPEVAVLRVRIWRQRAPPKSSGLPSPSLTFGRRISPDGGLANAPKALSRYALVLVRRSNCVRPRATFW